VPDNVLLVGIVSEEARNVWLQVARVALNPMLYGGGTNLKLLDYFAAGTPVVSTESGIRGTGAVANRARARGRQSTGWRGRSGPLLPVAATIERMTREARALAEESFDWRSSASASTRRSRRASGLTAYAGRRITKVFERDPVPSPVPFILKDLEHVHTRRRARPRKPRAAAMRAAPCRRFSLARYASRSKRYYVRQIGRHLDHRDTAPIEAASSPSKSGG
jgi:hypothetical protein